MFANGSVNHRLPSGPAVIREAPPVVGPNSVMLPATSIRPILLTPNSPNQSAPSGPSVMPAGPAPAVRRGKDVKVPDDSVSRQTAFVLLSVNQILPSDPLAIPLGARLQKSPQSGSNSVNWPSTVTLPIAAAGAPDRSVNQSAPSAPATMSDGWENRFGTTNSVMFPLASMRP